MTIAKMIRIVGAISMMTKISCTFAFLNTNDALSISRDLAQCNCAQINCSYNYGNGEGSNYTPKQGFAKCFKQCCEAKSPNNNNNGCKF